MADRSTHEIGRVSVDEVSVLVRFTRDEAARLAGMLTVSGIPALKHVSQELMRVLAEDL